MKIFKLFVLLLALSLVGCKKEMMGYEGVEGVYFAVQHGATTYGNERTWPYQPYTNVEFIQTKDTKIELGIKVMITGPSKDYDRKFWVEVNPDSTTAEQGVHFEPIPREVIVPAHAVSVKVPVILKRTADLRRAGRVLGLRLVANESFQLSFPNWDAIPSYTAGTIVKKFDASLHSIYLSDFLVKPNIWIGSIQPGNRESGQWGAYSEKKILLMMELMDLKYTDFADRETMRSGLSGLVAAGPVTKGKISLPLIFAA